MHAQLNEPTALVQVAVEAQPPLLVKHSLMSAQLLPVPVKPVLHAHELEPGVLVQLALTSQPPLLLRHSLTSVQVKPSPVKPVLHLQLTDLAPGVQTASLAHSIGPVHSPPVKRSA